MPEDIGEVRAEWNIKNRIISKYNRIRIACILAQISITGICLVLQFLGYITIDVVIGIILGAMVFVLMANQFIASKITKIIFSSLEEIQ